MLKKIWNEFFSQSNNWKELMNDYKNYHKKDIENSIKKEHETIKEKY